jgi:small nuclear ribonucleoprotein (snRNP)-like protein
MTALCAIGFGMTGEEFLKSIMGTEVHVTISDSRKVIGTLECVDSSANLILSDVEIFLSSGTRKEACQILSSVMVNGKSIVKIEQPIDDS